MRFIAILPAAISLFSLHLVPPAAAAQSASYKDQATADLYQQATDLLTKGRDFNKAAAMLTEAAKREPANINFQLALGCCYTSRYASVAFAMNRAESLEYSQREHARRMELWQRTRKLTASPFFSTTPPEPPSALATPDDGKPYNLTREEAGKDMMDLARKSLAAFKRARKLAEKATPEQRFASEYTRGWAALLLKRLGREIIYELPVADKEGKVVEEDRNDGHPWIRHNEAVYCFRACISELEVAQDKSEDGDARDQKKANCWQSLGLALVPNRLDNLQVLTDQYIKQERLAPEDLTEEASEAFKKALALKPGNVDLLYEMALVYAPTKPAESAACLEKVVRKQGTNAVIWYMLSEQYVRQADNLSGAAADRLHRKALNALETGNDARSYQSVPLNLPVPAWLTKAWGFDAVYGLGLDSRLSSYLYPYFAEIAKQEISRGNVDTAVEVSLGMMRFGMQSIAHYRGSDLNKDAPLTHSRLYMRSLMGLSNLMKGYALLKEAIRQQPTDLYLHLLENRGPEYEFGLAWDKEMTRPIPHQP